MRIEEIMTKNVSSCKENDSLNAAAQIMWEQDCGIVPIVNEASQVTGVITDRDICIAAYTQGRSLSEIPVWSASAKTVYRCSSDDTIERAETLMREKQIRRLPVMDKEGKLIGMLALSDLARSSHLVSGTKPNSLGPQGIALTLEAVSRPRATESAKTKAAPARKNEAIVAAH
jgi:CBS domain-containing protein